MDTCPVNCIHWVDYTELKNLEEERQDQVIPVVGFPVEYATIRTTRKKKRRWAIASSKAAIEILNQNPQLKTCNSTNKARARGLCLYTLYNQNLFERMVFGENFLNSRFVNSGS